MINSKIKTREATISDLDLVCDMYNEQFIPDHDGEVLAINKKHEIYLERNNKSNQIIRSYLLDKIESKDGILILAESEEILCGFILGHCELREGTFIVQKFGVISSLHVSKEYRRKGIATLLMNELKRWFVEKEIEHMSVYVHPDNSSALAFYKKTGFDGFTLEMRKQI